MTDRAERRADVLQQLSKALHDDVRLAGAVLVGSGAAGFRDDESDIDIVAPVAHAAAADEVFLDWRERISTVTGHHYLADTAATDQMHLLIVYYADRSEINISFPPLAHLRATAPEWRVLWQRSEEVTHRLSSSDVERADSAQVYIWTLNRAVQRVAHAARALRRGERWRTVLQLDELRRFILQLACLDNLGEHDVEHNADRLPAAILDSMNGSCPGSTDQDALQQSLSRCRDLLLAHVTSLDRRHGLRRQDAVAPFLDSFVPDGQH